MRIAIAISSAKKCFRLIILFALISPTTETLADIYNFDDAASQVIEKVYGGQLDNRAMFGAAEPLPAGARIAVAFTGQQLEVGDESWFFFIDEQPSTSWEHPASYVLIERVNGQLSVVPLSAPPEELPNLVPVNAIAEVQLSILDQSANSIVDVPASNPIINLPDKDNYAVLVSGGYNDWNNHPRYWNDLSFIFKALKERYNFDDEEIVMLYANGTHLPSQDIDGDGQDDVDFAATKANLANVLDEVADKIDIGGTFFSIQLITGVGKGTKVKMQHSIFGRIS